MAPQTGSCLCLVGPLAQGAYKDLLLNPLQVLSCTSRSDKWPDLFGMLGLVDRQLVSPALLVLLGTPLGDEGLLESVVLHVSRSAAVKTSRLAMCSSPGGAWMLAPAKTFEALLPLTNAGSGGTSLCNRGAFMSSSPGQQGDSSTEPGFLRPTPLGRATCQLLRRGMA
mmetsp:Transcript_61286/g.142565  ORF Transcript_61286/g.142565 Transcript_61286/m.142565 type:complete len:168 (+) Transcript_61286:249-752(+)